MAFFAQILVILSNRSSTLYDQFLKQKRAFDENGLHHILHLFSEESHFCTQKHSLHPSSSIEKKQKQKRGALFSNVDPNLIADQCNFRLNNCKKMKKTKLKIRSISF